ncbi:ribosomal protein S18-alanine N-acetyltransferase [Piscirickettsia salmonis]|uniref:ribosomal protein S18-alanine N-acetyltransferase n=1 Tax=Piscirickettsia salmonis TaxID=1238 RepID=UPI0007C93F57|nr:ribosomal-protein-alanine N-acetyltransferase [Piscirickettsiaceae bacterium NZ-RLO1]
MEKNQAGLSLRKVSTEDITTLFAIEQRAYEEGWSSDIMHLLLRTEHYYGRVLESKIDGSVCGYCFFSLIADECHLLNLCIMPELQGQGFGYYLLDAIGKEVMEQGAKAIFLEVRESNLAALKLYNGHGFQELSRRKGYYPKGDAREDALILVKNLEGN